MSRKNSVKTKEVSLKGNVYNASAICDAIDNIYNNIVLSFDDTVLASVYCVIENGWMFRSKMCVFK